VDEVDDDGTVLLEIAPGWVTRWEKAAVARILEPPTNEEPEEDEAAETAGTPEPVETSKVVQASEPAPEPGIHPTPEPGSRPLPGTAPPDRA
jgi:hypothetical protein